MTGDRWYVTHDRWRGVNISNFSSLALTVLELWCLEDLEEKDESLNEWMNDWIPLLFVDQSRLLQVYCTGEPSLHNQSLTEWPFSSKSLKLYIFKTIKAGQLKFRENVYPPTNVTCHMSHVICYVSWVTNKIKKHLFSLTAVLVTIIMSIK